MYRRLNTVLSFSLFSISFTLQDVKRVSFTACHLGRLWLACTSLKVENKWFWWAGLIKVLLSFKCPPPPPKKKKKKKNFTSPTAISMSHWLADITFFACWLINFYLTVLSYPWFVNRRQHGQYQILQRVPKSKFRYSFCQ